MKRKLVSVFLALTMCAALAVPAFAEPTEEQPVSEETEVLTPEVLTPEVHEHNEVGDKVFSWEGADLNWEKVETEDGVKWVAYWTSEIEGFSESGTYDASVGANCGHNNWGVGQEQEPFDYTPNNDSTHTAYYIVGYICKTPGCLGTRHDVMSRTESHSLSKTDFGSSYHQGRLHHIEWYCVCDQCGYTTTQWESRACPGNDSGVGCIFPINKVDPPVEELDVTGPEEAIEPEETDVPEEVIAPEETEVPEEVTPEEAAAPEEEIAPEETEPEEPTEPEEADLPEESETPEEPIETEELPEDVIEPEETVTPEETVEPEEPIEPEEPTIPEDPAGPGENVVPDDGESVE